MVKPQMDHDTRKIIDLWASKATTTPSNCACAAVCTSWKIPDQTYPVITLRHQFWLEVIVGVVMASRENQLQVRSDMPAG